MKLRNWLLCVLLLLAISGSAQKFYCRQFTLTVSDQLIVKDEKCYESEVTIEYSKNRVVIVTDSLTIMAVRGYRDFYTIDGDLYTFRDMRWEDGQRFVVLMPIRFNNKYIIKEKQAIEIATKEICK